LAEDEIVNGTTAIGEEGLHPYKGSLLHLMRMSVTKARLKAEIQQILEGHSHTIYPSGEAAQSKEGVCAKE
jgi:hypothetical protein